MAGTAGEEPAGAWPCPLHPGGWAQAPIVFAWVVGGVGLGRRRRPGSFTSPGPMDSTLSVLCPPRPHTQFHSPP